MCVYIECMCAGMETDNDRGHRVQKDNISKGIERDNLHLQVVDWSDDREVRGHLFTLATSLKVS